MSGGHYDYRTLQVRHLADDMADDAAKESDPKAAGDIAYCAAELKRLADLARAVEWYLSGDYGPEELRAEAVKAARTPARAHSEGRP